MGDQKKRDAVNSLFFACIELELFEEAKRVIAIWNKEGLISPELISLLEEAKIEEGGQQKE